MKMYEKTYRFEDISMTVYEGFGHVIAREYHTETPNGNPMNGRWVLRDADGTLIDFDKYRSDLAERNNIQLIFEKE